MLAADGTPSHYILSSQASSVVQLGKKNPFCRWPSRPKIFFSAFSGLCQFSQMGRTGLLILLELFNSNWSDFFYYGKSWSGKKYSFHIGFFFVINVYIFALVKSIKHCRRLRKWQFLCHFNFFNNRRNLFWNS